MARPNRALWIVAGIAALSLAIFLQIRGKSTGITFVAAGTVLVIAYAIHAFTAREG
jgi:hypothetical protein